MTAPSVPAGWNAPDAIPPVGVGSMKEYVVAVYRAHSGKVYTFAASYLNAYPLHHQDGCPKSGSAEYCAGCTEDGCPTTGWFRETGDDDDGVLYHRLSFRKGDELKGWREHPQWDAAAPPSPSPSSIPTEEEIEAVLKANLHYSESDEFEDGFIYGWGAASSAILKLLAEKGEK